MSEPTKCIVKGCGNYSDAGTMVGVLCAPCHEMITTGKVHHANPTFIGDLSREVSRLKSAIYNIRRIVT